MVGRPGPFGRKGAQDTPPPDETGGYEHEAERYEQESGEVAMHLTSLHHSW
ncbi:hypothetical protein GCM10010103_55900 [Streptomyces paradoxus]